METAELRNEESPVQGVVSTCIWSQDYSGSDMFETSCGNAFRLDDGIPSENKMKFCCFCGAVLKECIPMSDEEWAELKEKGEHERVK